VLVTAIHVFPGRRPGVDARDKPAHDGVAHFALNELYAVIANGFGAGISRPSAWASSIQAAIAS
jgi:hypothetical protein